MQPKHLKLWTHPANYAGEVWPAHYVGLGQHRDSDTLTRSNFQVAWERLKPLSQDGDVLIVRESHWAVGWVEWIAIEQDNEAAVAEADRIAGKLQEYPVLDEDHWSNLEHEEANQVWESCYKPSDRIDYIRQHRSQFEFQSLSDLIGCVRGKYFAGYASELLN
jgi:hypothetical protein